MSEEGLLFILQHLIKANLFMSKKETLRVMKNGQVMMGVENQK